ncbi:MAG: TlpA family protein disulfide reductase [Actinomycetales bacterium]|nr:TlpA family protein disulfide reductase [Actinomycetales bacterium]
MRERARLTALALSAVLVTASWATSACGRDTPAVPGVQTYAPDDRGEPLSLAGQTLDGGHLDVAQLRGTVVVVNNWASWCAPCRDEMPALVAASRAHPEIAVVGVNVRDERAAATAFAADLGIHFPVIADADGSILRSIPGVPPAALPSTVILDQQGRIAARVIGPTNPDQLEELIASATVVSPRGLEPTASPL